MRTITIGSSSGDHSDLSDEQTEIMAVAVRLLTKEGCTDPRVLCDNCPLKGCSYEQAVKVMRDKIKKNK